MKVPGPLSGSGVSAETGVGRYQRIPLLDPTALAKDSSPHPSGIVPHSALAHQLEIPPITGNPVISAVADLTDAAPTNPFHPPHYC